MDRLVVIRNLGGRLRDQPGWITRLAVLAFIVVVALPMLLLLTAAAVVALLVLGALAAGNAVTARLRRAPGRDGRENVRVIRREQR